MNQCEFLGEKRNGVWRYGQCWGTESIQLFIAESNSAMICCSGRCIIMPKLCFRRLTEYWKNKSISFGVNKIARYGLTYYGSYSISKNVHQAKVAIEKFDGWRLTSRLLEAFLWIRTLPIFIITFNRKVEIETRNRIRSICDCCWTNKSLTLHLEGRKVGHKVNLSDDPCSRSPFNNVKIDSSLSQSHAYQKARFHSSPSAVGVPDLRLWAPTSCARRNAIPIWLHVPCGISVDCE